MKTHFYTGKILEICDNNHYSVAEIFENIKTIFPDAGKSSIYRNVDELVQSGDLKKIVGIWKKAYYEKTKPEHIHLIDNITGEIHDIEKKDLHLAGLPSNFNIDSMDVKIFWKFS